MNNLIINFVDWYLETKEGKSTNYLAHSFKNDRDLFIAGLSEYAVEFAIAYGYNPFKIAKEKLETLKADLEREDSSFHNFSKSERNHVPRAILGKKNYLKFLNELYAENTATTVSLKKPTIHKQSTSGSYHYEKEELKKNFTFRLITQDRYYEFLYFPISVLKKLFYNNNRADFFNNWISTQIDNITIYIDQSNKLLFKDVATLDISNDGSVLINQKFKLHTAIAGEEAKKEISTTTLQNIVIDHVMPFEKVLFELKEQLPALQMIHNVLENINEGRISNFEDLKNAGNYLISNVPFTKQELDQLEKDMKLILNKLQLQLMDRYENLYKKRYS